MTQLFLSRLILNTRNRQVRRDLGDCQEMHRTIMRAFPEVGDSMGRARERFGVVYRAETDRNGAMILLVQSQVEPDWKILPADRGGEPYCLRLESSEPNPACKAISDSYAALRVGQRLQFRLRANPTRRVSEKCIGEKSNGYGKRVELYREDDQIAWLKRKGEGDPEKKTPSGGFHLISVQINPDVLNVLASQEGKLFSRQKRMTFNSVLFEGELEITRADDFRQALIAGIGPGKAYGFGLLSIAPPRR